MSYGFLPTKQIDIEDKNSLKQLRRTEAGYNVQCGV